MQTPQLMLMYKQQLQEMQRKQQLNEYNDPRQQNYINKQPYGSHFSQGLEFSNTQNHDVSLYGTPIAPGNINNNNNNLNQFGFSSEPFNPSFVPYPEILPGNFQQMNNIVQEQVQEQDQNQSNWSNQSMVCLDPLEEKILFNTDDNNWEDSLGSWSALMQSAVGEASSNETGPHEEQPHEQWSGPTFQNPDLQTSCNWIDNNSLQNISSTQEKYSVFQKQRDGVCSDSSHGSILMNTIDQVSSPSQNNWPQPGYELATNLGLPWPVYNQDTSYNNFTVSQGVDSNLSGQEFPVLESVPIKWKKVGPSNTVASPDSSTSSLQNSGGGSQVNRNSLGTNMQSQAIIQRINNNNVNETVSPGDFEAFGRSLKPSHILKNNVETGSWVKHDPRVLLDVPIIPMFDPRVGIDAVQELPAIALNSLPLPQISPPLQLKKRKISSINLLPWYKEVTHGLPNLLNISMAEEKWAIATNRIKEKIEDEVKVNEKIIGAPKAKRRLILTTQLMQQIFRPVPKAILSENSSNITYIIARSGLRDACTLTRFSKQSEEVEELKKVENYINQMKKLEDELLRMEQKTLFSDIKMESQELEKFSIVNNLAKFHRNGAESSSSIPKPVPRRYVIASPMPRNVPEGDNCFSL